MKSIFDDQDGAQAALQPAMSSAASHLTSSLTPAAEKAAALDCTNVDSFFDNAASEAEADDADGSDSEPASLYGSSPYSRQEANAGLGPLPGSPPSRQARQSPLPSAGAFKTRNIVTGKDDPSRPAKNHLESLPRNRSRSTGQEAFKKLQKAFPSLAIPTHLLPSLPTFFSHLTGDHKQSQNKQAGALDGSSAMVTQQAREQSRELTVVRQPFTGLISRTQTASRPTALRRVTSDDSLLYHSISRASSLGDGERFQDVREMVNIRFMALKDSLPEVPNFKIPSLAKLQAASRMSSISLNGFFSSFTEDSVNSRQPDYDRDSPSLPAPKAQKGAASMTLDSALEGLTGDIVILGGYRGSVLRSAEPPHHQLWAPFKLGFNMRKANLEVGLDDVDEESMEERIIPSGMLKHIGPIDISRKLFKRLRASQNARSCKLRVWDYGYDWRLSPALSSRNLVDFLATLPSNKPGLGPESRGAAVIAHSLGGLITRHAVNQRPDLFAGVLYAGVPQRCINILGPFRHGDAFLFNEKLLTAYVNFSIRTSFVLLPDDGFCFINKDTGAEYPIDFFDANDWIRWRLSPCVATVMPPYNRERLQASSPLSSLFPNSLLKGSRSDKKTAEASGSARAQERRAFQPGAVSGTVHRDRILSPQLFADTQTESASVPSSRPSTPTAPDRDRYVNYLRRTLAATQKFRAELAHRPAHESSNAYPPHAVLYGKSIPTVFAAHVPSRDAIACSDAYDDLLFRPGDGVVLAREAMLPEGYALVRSGRIRTECGHLTMLGDLPAVGQALQSLIRGRNKGIGVGNPGQATVAEPQAPARKREQHVSGE